MGQPRLPRLARNAVFAPLDQLSRPEVVARRLADAVALGLLRHDEQLPTEAELAERFGVSTVTVRQALSVLRQEGLVVTRRGRLGGSFVHAPDDPSTRVVETRLAELAVSELRDLGDHYAAIGGAAAALAAGRADGDDVARLRDAARQVAAASDPRGRRRAESLFHIEVAAAAQSARLTREEIALQREIAPLLWLPRLTRHAAAEVGRDHEAIVDAIEHRDADRARSHSEQHVHSAVAQALALRRKLSPRPGSRAR